MEDPDLRLAIQKLRTEIKINIDKAQSLQNQHDEAARTARPEERTRLASILGEKTQAVSTAQAKKAELDDLIQRTNSEGCSDGQFWLEAPRFPDGYQARRQPPQWTVLNYDFRETLLNREVKPSDPLLRLGDTDGAWEVELKVPQKHIGQVLHGLDVLDRPNKRVLLKLKAQAEPDQKLAPERMTDAELDSVNMAQLVKEAQDEGWLVGLSAEEQQKLLAESELDVDLLVLSAPTHTYQGKLKRSKIAGEATPHRDDNNESEPVVLAAVRIEGTDIPNPIPRRLLVAGGGVHAKIRCGDHALGYSLFYGVWEFLYEKVIFFF
jgi:hypothetical protein